MTSIAATASPDADFVANAEPSALALPPGARLLALFGPDLTLFALCAMALVIVGRLFGSHYVLRLSTMLLPGLVAPGIIALYFVRRATAIVGNSPGTRAELAAFARATLRDWLPLVLVAIVFDNLENYTGLVRATTIDASLYRIDLALFGVEPTVWVRRFYSPLLTDWMASCYAVCRLDRPATLRRCATAPSASIYRRCSGSTIDCRQPGIRTVRCWSAHRSRPCIAHMGC
jgi:hypothetical protein